MGADTLIQCPLCKETDNSSKSIVKSKDVVRHAFPNGANDELRFMAKVEEIWEKSTAEIKKCNNCKLMFAWPFVAGDLEFYSMLYHDSSEYSVDKWEYDASLNKLSEVNKSDDFNLLELGAGNGNFVKKAVDQNIVKIDNLLCTEYSNYSINEINNRGIKCINNDLIFEQKFIEENKFSAICLFQLLEHKDDLHEFFDSLTALLKSNGLIFIAVPNYGYREVFSNSGLEKDLPPIHLTRWNSKSFTYLADKYNLELVDHKIEKANFIFNMKTFLISKICKTKDKFWNDLKKNKLSLSFLLIKTMVLNFGTILKLAYKKNGISQLVVLRKRD